MSADRASVGNLEALILGIFHVKAVGAVNMRDNGGLVQLKIRANDRSFAYRLRTPAVFDRYIERLDVVVEISSAVRHQTEDLHFAHIGLNHGKEDIEQ